MANLCPEIVDYIAGEQCMENMAGTSNTVYIGQKVDLEKPMEATDDVYSTPEFKAGKGLYKIECMDEKQQIQGSSLGYRKGFEQTFNFTVEAVDEVTSKLARALNNLDIFIIVVDSDGKAQIMYNPNKKVKFDNGGITTDTGQAAADERVSNYSAKLANSSYPNLWVTAPEEGWDSLLKSKQA